MSYTEDIKKLDKQGLQELKIMLEAYMQCLIDTKKVYIEMMEKVIETYNHKIRELEKVINASEPYRT